MKNFKIFFALSALTLFLIACNQNIDSVAASGNNSALDTLKSPADFYPKKRAKVLVVGTFHFRYPNLDSHKTREDDQIDVLQEPKKSELEALVDYIKRFNPNKVAIEAHPSWEAMKKYAEFKDGQRSEERDERYTLGMRIAQDMTLDTLYSVDASSLISDLNARDSLLVSQLTDKIDWDSDDPYWTLAEKWLEYDDKLTKKIHLLDYFKILNSRENHQANYGLYLTGKMGKYDHQAADHLSMWWYNRNLRIFSKLVAVTDGPEDRILLIIGNGHAALLRHLFEASPQFEFVEFDEL